MTIRDILTNIRERLQKAGIEDFEYESWAFLDWKLHIKAGFCLSGSFTLTGQNFT